MSLQTCNGTNIGFPIKVSQNIFNPWSGGSDVTKLIAPMDFNVAWAPNSNQAHTVNVAVDNNSFEIDISPISSNTTLTYGSSTTYSCSPNLSLIQVQHANLCSDKAATQEAIISFTIQNKASNPSSPDVILFCRPVVLVESNNSGGFWPNVNRAAKKREGIRSGMNASDIQSIYAYNSEVMMPMMTYDTCIATQIKGSGRTPLQGSIHVRVHVVTQPLYIPSDVGGTGQCTNMTKYQFTSRIINIFNQPGYNIVQFSNGLNSYPNNNNSNLSALTPTATISTWADVVDMFEYLVPEQFLGKSLAEINKATKAPAAPKANKQYKCYKIDPQKDIKNGKIMIDPMTGESLEDAQKRSLLESSGGDAQLALGLSGVPQGQKGLSPGDIEQVVLIVISVIGGIFLIIYMYHIFNLFKNGDPDAYMHILIFIGAFITLFAATWMLSNDKKPGE
jgi:hypothetical protein